MLPSLLPKCIVTRMISCTVSVVKMDRDDEAAMSVVLILVGELIIFLNLVVLLLLIVVYMIKMFLLNTLPGIYATRCWDDCWRLTRITVTFL